MRYTKLNEHYNWEPICFEVSDILLLMKKAVMAELVVSFGGQPHWIGVACAYDREMQLFGHQIFYIDNQEFTALEDFAALAVLDGQRFADISEPLCVIATQEGDPTSYLDLVAKIRKDIARHAE